MGLLCCDMTRRGGYFDLQCHVTVPVLRIADKTVREDILSSNQIVRCASGYFISIQCLPPLASWPSTVVQYLGISNMCSQKHAQSFKVANASGAELRG